MSNYELSISKWQQDATISGLLFAIERGFEKFGVDYYLIGALARDTWMGLHDIQPSRATKDIDFAILIPDISTFHELKDYLVAQEGFNEYQENAFVLLWKDGTQVDLLPFGNIEDNGVVRVLGRGHTSINVDGFWEVYQQGLPEVMLETGNKFKFCSLHGIVLLKLIAWDDRPEMRTKDIHDICEILCHYFDISTEEIYTNHNDLFLDETSSLKDIAATVLGREIGVIISQNHTISNRILSIIDKNIRSGGSSHLARLMTAYYNNTVEDNTRLLQCLLTGIKHSIQ
jgi:predicted nucleotidyltransferase